MIDNPQFFFEKIKNKEPFALTRWGDGEIMIIEKSKKFSNVNKEFSFDPKEPFCKKLAVELLEALIYTDPDYYIGLAYFFKNTKWFKIPKNLVHQKDNYLTLLNIFIGHESKTMPLFFDFIFDIIENTNIKINWICPEIVKDIHPSFINKFWFLKKNAWKIQYEEILSSLLDYINEKENEFFMFSAGPFSNILIHKAWLKNKNNIYVDVGCIFDPFIFEKDTRSYFWKVKDELEKRRKIFEKYTKKKYGQHYYRK